MLDKDPLATAKLVQPYANYVVERLKNKSIENRENILIEGTFRTATTPIETLQAFKIHGYKTEVNLVACNRYVSSFSFRDRYENECIQKGSGRTLDQATHDYVYNIIPENLQKVLDTGLVDKIYLRTRSNEILASTPNEILPAYEEYKNNLPLHSIVIDRAYENVHYKMHDRGAAPSEFRSLSELYEQYTTDLDEKKEETLTKFEYAIHNMEHLRFIGFNTKEELLQVLAAVDNTSIISDFKNSCELECKSGVKLSLEQDNVEDLAFHLSKEIGIGYYTAEKCSDLRDDLSCEYQLER